MSAVFDKIEGILTDAYSVANYVDLMTEILDDLRIVAPNNPRKEFTNFSSHIESSTHVGTYTSPDGKKIIVMAVELKSQTYVENSRSTQRSYAKKLIENANADAALVAFYTPGDPRWRLSFVRLDYEMKIENGKLKTAENMTPARRYSFLVGKDEPCHTAIERFRLFIENHNSNPSLDDLENAFSVEAVTKEFFELYCEKFHQLREALEKNDDFVEEAKLHNYTSAQFAKKLMGQIVFLYFLQKKGWLGVSAWPRQLNAVDYKKAFFARGAKSRELIPVVYQQVDENTYKINATALNALSNDDESFLSTCVKGEPWGTGPHNFMRRLFETSEKRSANFFDDFLEPLFYDALNVNRGVQGYDPALHCRIPFLSGGLFEPIDGYDWKHNHFDIPNELFSNMKDHKDRLADGILDIFDRYNFTMSEDEPLEREVAIDPEMLGKVFENLLDVNDRKSKGAFYTPREIVHYMCQESLINYLINTMGVSEMTIRDFILYGDFMKDEDASVLKRMEKGGSCEMLISEELYQLNPDGTIKFDRMAELDKALQDVRVADPAVGSGAFPLGMLNEIVRARQNITTYMDITQKILDPKGAAKEIRYRRINDRSARQLKYDTIRNCIFAVDIEPSAVDIAQLRLWLALVIDDEIDPNALSALDGHRNPLPLPNLECNILCGNSLIDEYEGIKLINESDIIGTASEVMQVNLYQSAFNATLQRLIDKQDELFRCEDTEKKAQLLQDIDALREEVIMSQLRGTATSEQIGRYYETKSLASKPFILWQLDFARVFREKGGFDIVIGNPPYLDSENMTNSGLSDEREYISKKYFYCKGNWDIYIAFFEKGFALLNPQGFEAYITPDKWISKPFGDSLRTGMISNIKSIMVCGRKVFVAALVDSIVTILSRIPIESIKVLKMSDDRKQIELQRRVDKGILKPPFALDIIFSSFIDIISRLEKAQYRLGDFYQCENACSTGDCYILKDILASLESKSDYDSEKYYKVINTGTIDKYNSRWGLTPMKYLKEKYQYPVVLKEEFHKTFPNSYGQKPSKRKIIIKGLTLLDGSIDIDGLIVPGKSTMMIAVNDLSEIKYIAALVNSKVSLFYIKQRYSSSSYNGGINFTKEMINSIPIPEIGSKQKEELALLVDQILKMKEDNISSDISQCQYQIDSIVYEMYALTPTEIELIESVV